MASVDTPSYLDCFAELLNRVPMLGTIRTATAVGSTTITDAPFFGVTRDGLGAFNDRLAYRFNLTGADRVKTMGDLNSPNDGKINIASTASYVDNGVSADLDYAILGVHPDIIMGWFVEAQRRQRFIQDRALVIGHDGDMEASGALYWGTSGSSVAVNCTPTKNATEVFSGTQSLKLTVTASGGGVLGEKIRVTPGTQIYTGAILRLDSGTAAHFRIADGYAGGFLASSPDRVWSLPGNDWVYVENVCNVPSTSDSIQFGFNGSSAGNEVIYVDTVFGPYETGRKRYPLPTGLDEVYELPAVRPCRFTQSAGTDGFWAANSREWSGDWRPQLSGRSGDFFTEVYRRDVNPCNIQFREHIELPGQAIWLATAPQVSQFEALDSETATTHQPLDLVVSHAILIMAEQGYDYSDGADSAKWGRALSHAERRVASEVLMRPPEVIEKGHTRTNIGAPWGSRGGYWRG